MQLRLNVFDQAEVENDDAAVAVHEDVRRFDVAMQLAHLVQAIHSFGKLAQPGSQASLIQQIICGGKRFIVQFQRPFLFFK